MEKKFARHPELGLVSWFPKAQQHANYPGDQRHMAEKTQVVGPNTLGEYLVAVTADYTPLSDQTRVGFAYLMFEKEAPTTEVRG